MCCDGLQTRGVCICIGTLTFGLVGKCKRAEARPVKCRNTDASFSWTLHHPRLPFFWKLMPTNVQLTAVLASAHSILSFQLFMPYTIYVIEYPSAVHWVPLPGTSAINHTCIAFIGRTLIWELVLSITAQLASFPAQLKSLSRYLCHNATPLNTLTTYTCTWWASNLCLKLK